MLKRSLLLLVSATVLAVQPLHAEGPQPKLPTVPLVIGDQKVLAEVADEGPERETGMMFRKAMADGEGMVFVLDAPQKVSFWMKNTLIPLSVAYVNRSGMILEIHDLQPKDETPVPSKFDTIFYAIEVPQGWFEKNSILPGTMIKGLPKAPAGR
jgi:uncharacterized membrane protein (UPF0127 family)